MEGVEVAGEFDDGFDIDQPDPEAADIDLLDVDLDDDVEESFDPIEALGLDDIANDDSF